MFITKNDCESKTNFTKICQNFLPLKIIQFQQSHIERWFSLKLDEYPNSRQTEAPIPLSSWSLHSVPHRPLQYTSTTPLLTASPRTRRTCPLNGLSHILVTSAIEQEQ